MASAYFDRADGPFGQRDAAAAVLAANASIDYVVTDKVAGGQRVACYPSQAEYLSGDSPTATFLVSESGEVSSA